MSIPLPTVDSSICTDTRFSTGVPQTALPLWFDCYNIASTIEHVGVGIWAGRHTAPEWEPNTVADGILRSLVGEESDRLWEKARALSKVARGYGGRDAAARKIAELAKSV